MKIIKKSFYFKRAAICGTFAKKEVTGPACALRALNNSNFIFISCGERKLFFDITFHFFFH